MSAPPSVLPVPIAGQNHGKKRAVGGSRGSRLGMRAVVLVYLGLLVLGPVLLMTWSAFAEGLAPMLEAIASPAFRNAFWLTLLMVAVAVPLNTVFGVACALVVVRHDFPGKGIVDALLTLPLGVSPVVVGLALVILYSPLTGWFGPRLRDHGVMMLYAPPAMILATVFVSLPFVAREVIPVLREIGTDQEQAAQILGASGWQTFWLVTLPAIRTGVAYGVVLTTARALGEYGAVAIVSGKLAGRTETLTLHVEERWLGFDPVAAYTTSVVLALMALLVLVLM
ncbi:MAG TPA: sulfate ABC transporter permease subunit, partial [Thermomicrobiales bacterium]|nr:sulfate ABC transporter permease subunit [Thermomicrobiales bacterium]